MSVVPWFLESEEPIGFRIVADGRRYEAFVIYKKWTGALPIASGRNKERVRRRAEAYVYDQCAKWVREVWEATTDIGDSDDDYIMYPKVPKRAPVGPSRDSLTSRRMQL